MVRRPARARAAPAERGPGLRRDRPRPRPGHARGARACCPRPLARADAVFNLGRMGLLRGRVWPTRTSLVPEATDDRIHQPARTALFPEAPGCCARWSTPARWRPAGPGRDRRSSASCRAAAAETVRAGAEAALAAAGVPGRALVLRADRRGIVYGDEADVAALTRQVTGRPRPGQRGDVALQLGDRRVHVEGVEHLVVVGLGRLRVAEDLQAVGQQSAPRCAPWSGPPAAP